MQRVHVDDLVGRLLEQGGWEHLCLPAIAEADEFVPIGRDRAHKRLAGEALQPERESLETLHALKNSMGAHNFAAQYQQNPVPPEGSLIKRNWIKFFDAMPARKPGDIVVQSWDTAIKSTGQSDYSVCMTALIRGNDCFVLDVFRDRLDFPDLCREVTQRYREWSPKVALIEEAGSGASLLQQIRRDRINTKAIRPEGSKELRMARESIALEAGRGYFRQDAPWLGDLMNELLAFPASKHDDQVDALSQLLGWMDKRLMGHQIFV